MKELYTLLFSNPNVGAITWRDFSGQGTWKGAPARLIRKDMTPKPAYLVLNNLINNEWWTQDTLTVADGGMINMIGFFGDYSIHIIDNERTYEGKFELKKVQDKPINIVLK